MPLLRVCNLPVGAFCEREVLVFVGAVASRDIGMENDKS